MRYRFQGRERSAATGLVNFRMRWYDPATGRWLSKDPIGLSGGLNLYAFCLNSPINSIDPFGLAHVGTRPLDAGKGNTKTQKINNGLSHLNFPGNLDPRHAEIFFDDDDCPSHIGYGPSGVGPDKSGIPYNGRGSETYDDKTMREAVEKLSDDPAWSADKYNVISHNCQDFVSAAIEEYNRMKK